MVLATLVMTVQAAPVNMESTKGAQHRALTSQTVYLPSRASACAECVRCPTLATQKEQQRCYAKFCVKLYVLVG